MSDPSQVKVFRDSLAGGLLTAPLAGTSDPAWYGLLAPAGPRAFYGEMLTADGLYRGSRKTRRLIDGGGEGYVLEGFPRTRAYPDHGVPVVCQLFGHEPAAFAMAAAYVEECGYEAIDINYGCPAKKVVRSGNGVALMREPTLAVELLRAAVESVSIPVTAKLRLGWNDDREAYLGLGESLARAGAALLTLHPRTREEAFAGHSDWGSIGRLREAVEIPVVGNGDVGGPADARRMIEQTGCHAVMVGRALVHEPWQAGRISAALEGRRVPAEPDWRGRLEWVRFHGTELARCYGMKVGMLRIRRFALHYLRGVEGARELRRRVVHVEALAELEGLLDAAAELGSLSGED